MSLEIAWMKTAELVFLANGCERWQCLLYNHLILFLLQDVLKFGFSTREYVILTEKSRDEVHEDQ